MLHVLETLHHDIRVYLAIGVARIEGVCLLDAASHAPLDGPRALMTPLMPFTFLTSWPLFLFAEGEPKRVR
jgi:hypothetical protein